MHCKRRVDSSFTNQAPYIPDIVIAMEEGLSWEAGNVTDGIAQSMTVTNVATVNVLHGGTNHPAAIFLDGSFARFAFRAGSSYNLHVRNVSFGRRDIEDQFVAGSVIALTFNDGSPHAQIPSGGEVWTDWVRYEIDRDESYLVRWERRDSGNAIPTGQTDARVWVGDSGHTLSYQGTEAVNRMIALTAMEVRAPSNAVYRSGVFDTRVADPQYSSLSWSEVSHGSDGYIGMRVRSSDYADMRDALWYPAGYPLSNHASNDISWISGGRFVQYEATMQVAGDHTLLPVLRDVTIAWEAPTGIVDLVLDLARGPDYGILRAEVNGQSFIKGVEVALEIFKEGPHGEERVAGLTEVRPLNTGR